MQIRGIVVTFLVLLVVFQVVSNSSKANQWHLGLQRQNALWVAHPTARKPTKQPVTLTQGILGSELTAGETAAAASSSLTGKQQRKQVIAAQAQQLKQLVSSAVIQYPRPFQGLSASKAPKVTGASDQFPSDFDPEVGL